MARLDKDRNLVKESEEKLTNAIFKVIKTSGGEVALACSGGLYFARYDNQMKKFVISSDFLLMDHLVTQIVEVDTNKFVVGLWGVSWVGFVNKEQRTLVKIACPATDET